MLKQLQNRKTNMTKNHDPRPRRPVHATVSVSVCVCERERVCVCVFVHLSECEMKLCSSSESVKEQKSLSIMFRASSSQHIQHGICLQLSAPPTQSTHGRVTHAAPNKPRPLALFQREKSLSFCNRLFWNNEHVIKGNYDQYKSQQIKY